MSRIFSLEKIAKGDKMEEARLLYSIAPSKFTTLAKHQGVDIESLEDVEALVLGVTNKDFDFNFNKLFRNLPISARELKQAGKSFKVI